MNGTKHLLATDDAGDDGSISGRCDRCGWRDTAHSHAAMVKAYQDHLRIEHPKAWLRE
ncbi:hypothetical protein [Halegenticoccus tardaugens]|uniref:hypothetical protein n=1 Tax=Halegenticoccus tardaugens TaxID=2071624 RepID=UPI0013E932C6|nr:hypothetical protein [Halegenticoccus tardaugens]